MARSSDLAGIIRGLEKVLQSLAEHQQKELSRIWVNSSLRSALQDAGTKTEERISDFIVKQDGGSRDEVSQLQKFPVLVNFQERLFLKVFLKLFLSLKKLSQRQKSS